MRTSDIARPLTAKSLNENLFKQFNVKINFDKYTREQLEDARNKYRSKLFAQEAQANFNDLLNNESYQRDKYVLDVLNTRIKEMLGESIAVMERALSKAQQQAAGIALSAKRSGKKPAGKGASAQMAKMSTKELEKFAKTKHKGLPKHKKTNEAVDQDSDGDNDFDDVQIARYTAGGMSKKKAIAKAHADKNESQGDEKRSPAKVQSRTVKMKKQGGGEVEVPVRKVQGWQSQKADKASKDDDVDEGFVDTVKQGVQKGVNAVRAKNYARLANRADNRDDYGSSNKFHADQKVAADRRAKADQLSGKQPAEGFAQKKFKESRNVIAESIAYYIAEDEEGKAKSITAAADMVNDFTSWMQRVGNYQTKSMIELADNIRANFGMQEAETFKQSVAAALEGALTALTQAREEINNSVAVLAGEAPAQEPMGMDSDVGDTGSDMNIDMDQTAPDEMNAGGDEFAASDAAAGGPETTGRMKRESIERGNRLMRILGA